MKFLGDSLRLALLAPSVVLSATEDPTAPAAGVNGAGPITIVISPRWQIEEAARSPGSATVLPSAALQRSGTDDTLSLQYRVPGFVMKTNAILGQPYLRGIGSDIISAGTEPTVATFVDGFYLPRAAQSLQQLFDVDRVEVLKGPQSVHLGRNVIGGAVSVLTRQPLPYRGATVEGLLGSDDRRQVRVTLNEPLLGGDAALRLTGLAGERDGYVRNNFLDDRIDDEDLEAWRLSYRYAPEDGLDVVASSHGFRDSGSRNTGWSPDPGVPGSAALALGGTSPADMYEVNHNRPQQVDLTQRLHGLRIVRRLRDIELVSATSVQRSEGILELDLDGTQVDFATNVASDIADVFTQEFRIRSIDEDADWRWVGGAFLLYEDASQTIDVGLPLAFANNRTAGEVETFSWAAFGEVSWTPNPHWTLSAGLRYTRDKRELELEQVISDPFGAVGPAGTTVIRQQDDDSWSRLTPELAVSFAPDRGTFYWARVASGFKSGGYNTAAAQPGFEPERLTAWEVGIKQQFPAQDVYAELSVFYYDYRDMQLRTPPADAPVGTFPSVINAARSSIKGVDAGLRYRPDTGFGAALGAVVLDARFDDFVSRDPNRPALDPDHSGERLPQAPEVSLNVDLDYRWSHPTLGRFTASAGYRYQSAVFYGLYEDPATRQGGYGLLDAGLVWQAPNGGWSLQLFGTNLTGEEYWKGIVRQDPLVGTLRNPGAPRTLGLRVRLDL